MCHSGITEVGISPRVKEGKGSRQNVETKRGDRVRSRIAGTGPKISGILGTNQ